MLRATFLTRWDGSAAFIPLEEGETLESVVRQVDVMRDTTALEDDYPEDEEGALEAGVVDVKATYDEEGVLLGWNVTRRALETVDHRVGGFVCQSAAPPGSPPGSVVVVIQTTQAMIDLIDARLQADDPLYMRIGEIREDA